MKVIAVSTDASVYDPASGTANRMIQYAKEFDQMHIIVFSLDRSCPSNPIHIGQNVWVYPTRSFSKVMYCLDARHLLGKIVGNTPTDEWVVTTQDPFETGIMGAYAKYKWGIPFQVQIHTDIGSSFFQNSFTNKIRLYISNFVTKYADTCRVVSERVRSEVMRRYNFESQDVYILPVWVDAPRKIEQLSAKDILTSYARYTCIIIMLSRIEREKNHMLALRAVEPILKKHADVGMIIVGDGSMKDEVVAAVNARNIGDQVFFESHTEQSEAYYALADIFLLTSDYEGYGRTLIEAALQKCAIVTTNVGIVGSIFHNNQEVLACPAGDGMCLEKHIEQLVSAPEDREAFARRSYERAQKEVCSGEEYAVRYKAILQETMHSVRT